MSGASEQPPDDLRRLGGEFVPTGWPRVDRIVGDLRNALASATVEEDFQTIGLKCREALISLAQTVFDPAVHSTLDGVKASDTDAKRMLEAYIASAYRGGEKEQIRKHARSALDLAVAFQHKRTATLRDAAICAEATTSVVNVVAILTDRRGAENLGSPPPLKTMAARLKKSHAIAAARKRFSESDEGVQSGQREYEALRKIISARLMEIADDNPPLATTLRGVGSFAIEGVGVEMVVAWKGEDPASLATYRLDITYSVRGRSKAWAQWSGSMTCAFGLSDAAEVGWRVVSRAEGTGHSYSVADAERNYSTTTQLADRLLRHFFELAERAQTEPTPGFSTGSNFAASESPTVEAEWKSIAGSIEAYGDKTLLAERERLTGQIEEATICGREAEEELRQIKKKHPGRRLDFPSEWKSHEDAVRQRLSDCANQSDAAKREFAKTNTLLDDDIRTKLQSGIMIAKGFRAPHVSGNVDVEIPSREWPILTLDRDRSSALAATEPTSVVYTNVRIRER